MAKVLAAMAAMAIVGCASPRGGGSSGDPCAEARAHRDQYFFVIDLDAGDAAPEGDVVVLGADASPPCERPCMQQAAALRLDAPAFLSCTESNVSIGCTLETHQPQPCDLINP